MKVPPRALRIRAYRVPACLEWFKASRLLVPRLPDSSEPMNTSTCLPPSASDTEISGLPLSLWRGTKCRILFHCGFELRLVWEVLRACHKEFTNHLYAEHVLGSLAGILNFWGLQPSLKSLWNLGNLLLKVHFTFTFRSFTETSLWPHPPPPALPRFCSLEGYQKWNVSIKSLASTHAEA